MRWVEVAALLATLLAADAALADTPAYGKVETFQPGKKYNCVPTADRKGWNCNESGKAEAPPERAEAPPTSAPAQERAASAPAAVEPPPKSSALPNYLTNAAAGGTSALPRSTQATPPPPHDEAPPPNARSTEPVNEPVAEKPMPPPTQAVSAPPATGEHSAAGSAEEFLALPGDKFAIEIAQADSAAGIAALRDRADISGGKVYALRLRQNGGERWLLLWGAFDTVEMARSARDRAAAQGLTIGWPRRIGPLQAEARRTSE